MGNTLVIVGAGFSGTGKLFAAELADGPPSLADRVILAPGNPPPPLLPWAAAVRSHPAYRHDPWDVSKNLTAEHSVLIVGNGLTMTDVAMNLTQDASRAPALHTVSRRRLVPLSQTAFRLSAMRGDGAALRGSTHEFAAHGRVGVRGCAGSRTSHRRVWGMY
jgi:hypothetical protein